MKSHWDYNSQGYIGITCDFKKRMRDHFRKPENKHLINVFAKYKKENIEIVKLIENVSKEEVLLLEVMLRPHNNIGWNIKQGGELAPCLIGKKNALGNKSRTGQVKFLIKAVKDNVELIFRGKKELLEFGFDASSVYKCLYENKTHKGYSFIKIPLP